MYIYNPGRKEGWVQSVGVQKDKKATIDFMEVYYFIDT